MHLSADEVKAEFLRSFPAGSGELAFELSNDITYLHLKWKLYRQLFGTSQERFDLLFRTAPAFFVHLDRIMRHDVVLAITRLTDPSNTAGHENLSLERLVVLLEPHIDASRLSDWRSALAILNALAKPLRDARNQFLAHRDLTTILSYQDQTLPSRADMETLLRHIREVFGSIEENFRGSFTSYDLIDADGGDQLIASLERAQAHSDCERAEFKRR
jgi:hypothetical protein